MAKEGLKRQALTVTAANGLTRAMGFVLRLLLAYLLGAEALGVSELASSVYMLVLTPVVAGLPAAVSRLTAVESEDRHGLALHAGQKLVMHVALILTPLFIIASPFISMALGDTRTVYALLTFSPCIPILALSSVYDGYLFGLGDVRPPARSDLIEQVVRIGACVLLLSLLKTAPTTYRAAVPALCMTLGEGVGLIYLIKKTGPISLTSPAWRTRNMQRTLFHLAAPLTLSRLVSAALKTATSIMIPWRLLASGLSYQQGIAQLGIFAGMAMPVLFLPVMPASALSAVGTPAIARLRKENVPAFARKMLLPACLVGALGAVAVFFAAPLIADKVFRQPLLRPLLQVLCPLCLTSSLQAVLSGIYNGLGKQKTLFYLTMISSPLTLALTYFLAAIPNLRLIGAGLSMLAGQGVYILLALLLLKGSVRSLKNC